MKKSLLLLFFCLLLVQAFAQKTLPEQLLGNWLSPKNNEWKYGFHEQYAIADGTFWQYEVVKQKKNSLELLLKNGNKQQRLFIALAKDGQIKIGATKKDAVLLTQQHNEQPDYAHYDKQSFQQPLIQPGIFRLSGVINGYDPRKDDYKYTKVIYNHLIEDNQKSFIAEVDSLGRFSLDFPLMNPQEIMFKFGDRLEGFYAVPGSSVLMCINDLRKNKPVSTDDYVASIKQRNDILFMGDEGMLNTEMNDYTYYLRHILDFQEDSEQVKKLDQLDYKIFRMSKMEEQLQHVKAYAAQHRSGKRFEQQLEQRIKYHAAEDLLRYSWLKDYKKRVPLTDEYLAFTKVMPVNNEMGVIAENYAAFIHEIANLEIAGMSPLEQSLTLSQVIDAAKAAGFTFKPEDEALLKSTETPNNNLKEDEIARINALALKYQESMNAGANQLFALKKEERAMEVLSRLGGTTPTGLSTAILTAKIAEEHIAQNKLLSAAELTRYKEAIQHPAIFEALETKNNHLQKVLAGGLPAEANIISPLKEVQDKMLESLLSKYAGKVVYIDFWAPWCGPCMGEMPNSKVLKKELAGKDVVFLYLGVNCSKESWEKAIKTSAIEGEHYLLNKNEYALLSERFQISGIPRYILVDKTGQVTSADAKRPGDKEGLIQDINLLLK